MSKEINLLDYLIVLLKRKKSIFAITFLGSIVAVAVSFFLPKIYRSETRIMPPVKNVPFYGGIINDLPSGLIDNGLFGLGGENIVFIEMLKSRTLLDRIIDIHNLKDIYTFKYPEEIRKKLLDNSFFTLDKKSQVITISFEDHDPQFASKIANTYVVELQRRIDELAIEEASQKVRFWEKHLADIKKQLTIAEENMKSYQKETGALSIDAQVNSGMKEYADLEAEINAKEIEIEVMRVLYTDQSPDVLMEKEMLKTMKQKAEKIKMLRLGKTSISDGLPTIAAEYLRLYRELKFREYLYETLQKQFEIAKIEEYKSPVVLQVLDEAIPPNIKAKPQRAKIVIIVTFMSFIIAVIIAFVNEYLVTSYDNPDSRKRINDIKRYFSFRS